MILHRLTTYYSPTHSLPLLACEKQATRVAPESEHERALTAHESLNPLPLLRLCVPLGRTTWLKPSSVTRLLVQQLRKLLGSSLGLGMTVRSRLSLATAGQQSRMEEKGGRTETSAMD